MNALILYFSGTGNTKYAAQKFEQELKNRSIRTEIHSIEEDFSIKPDTYDLLILGCPKYYECPVSHFVRYLKKHLPINQKEVSTLMFCTQTGPLQTDYSGAAKVLARKNHKLTVSKSIQMANNFLIFKAFAPTDEQEAKERVKQVEPTVKELVDQFLGQKEESEHVSRFMSGMEHAVAVTCDKLFPVFAMKYSASEDCIGCGLCAGKCPKNNITMKDKKPEFGKNCMFCMRCINLCPANAILYHGTKFPQYSIKKALYEKSN